MYVTFMLGIMLGVENSENSSTDVCKAIFDADNVRYSNNGRLFKKHQKPWETILT